MNIIEQYYKSAVSEIDETLLGSFHSWYSYVLRLPKREQIVYTVEVLNQQVSNGGFHQYFANQYGQFAYLTIENLRIIGANDFAELVLSATSILNDDNLDEESFGAKVYRHELDKIESYDKELCDYLDSLDSKYYELDIELLTEKLTEYLLSVN
jgi:hypothetical protein